MSEVKPRANETPVTPFAQRRASGVHAIQKYEKLVYAIEITHLGSMPKAS